MLKEHVREVRDLNFQEDPSSVSRDTDAWPLKGEPRVCPKKSANKYQFTGVGTLIVTTIYL